MEREGGNGERMRNCRKSISLFPHFLSISSSFPHSLSISSQPGSKAPAGCATLPNPSIQYQNIHVGLPCTIVSPLSFSTTVIATSAGLTSLTGWTWFTSFNSFTLTRAFPCLKMSGLTACNMNYDGIHHWWIDKDLIMMTKGRRWRQFFLEMQRM